jgi:hypothetical protein
MHKKFINQKISSVITSGGQINSDRERNSNLFIYEPSSIHLPAIGLGGANYSTDVKA